MKKFLTFLAIVVSGCMVAGVYGVLHDQLTYTISSEYYTKFKFVQFGFVEEGVEPVFQHPRFYVSLVGFLATWWMGVPVAVLLWLFSLHSDNSVMTGLVFRGFIVTMTIACITGLYGLYEGYTHLAHQPKEYFRGWFIPDNLENFRAFIAVGSMHNHGYFGGLFGLIGGLAYVGWRKAALVRMNKRTLVDEQVNG